MKPAAGVVLLISAGVVAAVAFAAAVTGVDVSAEERFSNELQYVFYGPVSPEQRSTARAFCTDPGPNVDAAEAAAVEHGWDSWDHHQADSFYETAAVVYCPERVGELDDLLEPLREPS